MYEIYTQIEQEQQNMITQLKSGENIFHPIVLIVEHRKYIDVSVFASFWFLKCFSLFFF